MSLSQHLGAIFRIGLPIVADTAKKIEEQKKRRDDLITSIMYTYAYVCGKHTFFRFLTLITWLFRLYLGLSHTHTTSSFFLASWQGDWHRCENDNSPKREWEEERSVLWLFFLSFVRSFFLPFESFDICVRVHCTVIPFLLLLLLSSSPGIVVPFLLSIQFIRQGRQRGKK